MNELTTYLSLIISFPYLINLIASSNIFQPKLIRRMQLSDRHFMVQTRYTQSFGDFSQRKNKLLSTGFTKNLINTTTTLPKLSRSLSSSTAKSTNERMSNITESVLQIKSKTEQLKMDTRQSRRYVNFMKEDLVERGLTQQKSILSAQIKKLSTMFKYTRKQHQERTTVIRKTCSELTSTSRAIIDQVENLRVRIDMLEDTMGVYSGKERHKF